MGRHDGTVPAFLFIFSTTGPVTKEVANRIMYSGNCPKAADTSAAQREFS